MKYVFHYRENENASQMIRCVNENLISATKQLRYALIAKIHILKNTQVKKTT